MALVTVIFATPSFNDRCVAVVNNRDEFAVFCKAATDSYGGSLPFDQYLRDCVRLAPRDFAASEDSRRRCAIATTVWALLLPQPPATVPDPANRLGNLIGGGCDEITVTITDLDRLDDYRVEIAETADRQEAG